VQELNSLIVSNNRISQIPERLLAKLPNLTKISMCVDAAASLGE
jgi:Leucine-rich repeat (LRR) protein